MTYHHQTRRPRQAGAWPTVQMLAAQVNQQVNKDTLRVGDAEREEAARVLGEHFASGRLDRDEYDERLEAIFAARTGGDLATVFRDLPGEHPRGQRPAAPGYERPTRRRGPRLPFLPMLFILIGLAIVLSASWIFWVGLGALFLLNRGACSLHRWPVR